MLRLAEKAFWPAAIPFPVMHVDTGHNFPEVLEFRDRRVDELGLQLIVASVQDAIDRGHRARGAERLAQPDPDPGAARGGGEVPLRRAVRRRPPRRGEGPRQGAGLLLPRRVRPVGPEEPAARAVDPLQRPRPPGREHPGLPAVQLDRAGHLAVHRPGGHRAAVDLLRPRARGVRARRHALGRHRVLPAARGREVFTATVRYRTVGDATLTAAVYSDADTVEKIIEEVAATRITERGATRGDDKVSEAAMEDRKKEGYF